MINTSKKYQKRVKRLKDHKNDEEGRPHQEKIKSYSSNIKLSQLNKALLRENLENHIPIIIDGFKDENSERTYGEVKCYGCKISRLDDREHKIDAAILDIERTHHEENIVEILAEPYLRDFLNLRDGEKVIIELTKN